VRVDRDVLGSPSLALLQGRTQFWPSLADSGPKSLALTSPVSERTGVLSGLFS
jgi:hypothetical protein